MLPTFKKILYATDLSPNSVYALRYAMNTALRHGAEIIILHVFENVDPASRTMLSLYLDAKRSKEIFNEHKAEAQNLIKERLRTLRDNELKDHPGLEELIISTEVYEGFPAEVILGKADESNCDAIVMGTHSKGIIENTFLGSTAKRVLRRTRKPVFIVPLPKGEADMSLDNVSRKALW
ncbi:MAG: universal stress protein [Nitrospinales bacterium]